MGTRLSKQQEYENREGNISTSDLQNDYEQVRHLLTTEVMEKLMLKTKGNYPMLVFNKALKVPKLLSGQSTTGLNDEPHFLIVAKKDNKVVGVAIVARLHKSTMQLEDQRLNPYKNQDVIQAIISLEDDPNIEKALLNQIIDFNSKEINREANLLLSRFDENGSNHRIKELFDSNILKPEDYGFIPVTGFAYIRNHTPALHLEASQDEDQGPDLSSLAQVDRRASQGESDTLLLTPSSAEVDVNSSVRQRNTGQRM